MPFDLLKGIEEDFRGEKYDIKESKYLDSWVSFYFKHGRFPGNADLTFLPQTHLPTFIDPLTVEILLLELYKKFGNGDAKSLVSFQAILALFLYYGGEVDLVRKAMNEWKSSLTFQALSKENDKYTMKFNMAAEIVYYFLRAFQMLESEFEKNAEMKLERSNYSIDTSSATDFSLEEAPELILHPKTSTPKKTPIRRPPIPSLLSDTSATSASNISEKDSAFLKTSLTISRPNLVASIEAAEKEEQEIFRSIIDPTPG